jgi:DNA polymerase III epsilon subunit-like protein
VVDSGSGSTLVFVDTETTSQRPDRRVWDVALIIRQPGSHDREMSWLVDFEDLDLGNANLPSLKIGHFYERHPFATSDRAIPVYREVDVLREVERLSRGAHLVGAVPSFDAEVLAARMRAHGIPASWHHHLIDVETLAVGRLSGERLAATAGSLAAVTALPWDIDAVSRAFGVEPPPEHTRHTALGDARWVRAIYDAVMGGL